MLPKKLFKLLFIHFHFINKLYVNFVYFFIKYQIKKSELSEKSGFFLPYILTTTYKITDVYRIQLITSYHRNQMSSQHQSKNSENSSNQTRRSIYLSAPNRNSTQDNSQANNQSGNDNSAVQEEKTFRYIKYLKEQNLQLKQQLDKERQVSSFKVNVDTSMPRGNDQLKQIQVNQFQVQLASLQNEFNRYKSQNESQYKERLDQIENLLREKQLFMVEKEKMACNNKSLAEQVKELKQATDNSTPEEKRKQIKQENDKLKDENNRIKSEIKKARSQRDKTIAENEKLQKEINQLKSENKKLKQSNQKDANQDKQSEKKSSERKTSPTRTTEKNKIKPRSSSVLPKETSKSHQKSNADHKNENEPIKKNRPESSIVKTRSITDPNNCATNQDQDRINDLQTQVQNLSRQLKDKKNAAINQDRINDLQAQVKVLSHQVKSKSEMIDKLRAKNSEEKKNYEKLRLENAELNNKCNKYIDETNLCNATIIRQKNNLDDKDKEIDLLQMKQSKIKKLIKVVSNIKSTNIILQERNRELEQRLRDSNNSVPNITIHLNADDEEPDIDFEKLDSLLDDLK